VAAEAGFAGGTGDPSVATDLDGDGRPDERVVPPVEAKLAAIQKQLDDTDYEFRKKFKTTAALLEAYRREIESLRTQNGQLERRYTDLASTTGALGSRIGSAEAQARSAAAAASVAESRAESVGVQVSALSDSVDERTGALARRADPREKPDEELQSTVDAVATDLDEKSSELKARTERLGDRATDLAERTEQVAQLQRTVYAALVDEFTRQIAALERRSHSRLYRMFNKKEARAQLADLRRRIQLVRAQLQATDDPDAPRIDRELVELQSSIGPVEERYK
jgi:prefoldin subunit 5